MNLKIILHKFIVYIIHELYSLGLKLLLSYRWQSYPFILLVNVNVFRFIITTDNIFPNVALIEIWITINLFVLTKLWCYFGKILFIIFIIYREKQQNWMGKLLIRDNIQGRQTNLIGRPGTWKALRNEVMWWISVVRVRSLLVSRHPSFRCLSELSYLTSKIM